MHYFISRGGQQYGPYAPSDVQRYLADGSIQDSDLARTDAMSEWLPLSQILNQSPGAVFPQTVPAPAPAHAIGPVPPGLHWVIVFLLGMFTGVFHYVWMFVQASFIRKIDRQSKAMLLYILGLVAITAGVAIAVVFALVMSYGSEDRQQTGAAIAMGILMFVVIAGGSTLIIAGTFSIRSSMLRHYNTVEPIQLRLSAIMTFFFNTLYIQYHFSRIAKWKETGIIYPQ